MKNIFCFILFLFALVVLSEVEGFAQKQDSLPFRKNMVYVEGLGNAGLGVYSFNYEGNIGNTKSGFLIARIGYSRLYGESGVNIPVLLGSVSNRNRNHHLETCAGMIFLIYEPGYHVTDYWALTGNVMYRYQKPNGRFVFRVGWTPSIYYNIFRDDGWAVIMIFDVGASIGFAF